MKNGSNKRDVRTSAGSNNRESNVLTNFKNKEEWNSIKVGVEQHKSSLGCSL